MKGKNQVLLALFLMALSLTAEGQENTKNWTLSGYVSNLESAMSLDLENMINPKALQGLQGLPQATRDSIISAMVASLDSITGGVLIDNVFHNRLNLFWYPNDRITFTAQARTRFFIGDQVRLGGREYANSLESDVGWLNMSWNLIEEKAFVLNSQLDRLWLQYRLNKMEVKIGRQRINWGQNFAWNPNDLFNTYSFFDFDYEEKPGSDAVRIQYYTGVSSVAEVAVKIDSSENITAAAKYRFSRWNYDFQFLGGILNDRDWVAGMGWAGDIKGAGFRGEVSYFHPKRNFTDTTGVWIASLGADYTFRNSFMLQLEALYSGASSSIQSFEEFYAQPLSVKTISFTDWSILVQASYPITPLLNASLSGMYFPSIDGMFIGPTLGYSLHDNLSASIILQHFNGEFTSGKRQNLTLGFLRLKYNF